MRKTPYTTGELFDEICKKIDLPGILDYHLADTLTTVPILDYEWDFLTDLTFGGSEGIYLRVYKRGSDSNFQLLGTFKTLRDDKEAMEIMGKLAGDFIYEGTSFLNKNLDDFTWNGYQVSISGKPVYEIKDLERAKEKCRKLKEEHEDVTLFSFADRKEVSYD